MSTITFTVTADAFVNDVCLCQVREYQYIRLYSIDEDFKTNNGTVGVHRIICELIDIEGEVPIGYSLPNIIGVSNSVFGIKSDRPSVQGELLSLSNIEDCVLEYYDAAD